MSLVANQRIIEPVPSDEAHLDARREQAEHMLAVPLAQAGQLSRRMGHIEMGVMEMDKHPGQPLAPSSSDLALQVARKGQEGEAMPR